MMETVVHTPQSSTGVKPTSPMATSPTARLNRRSAPTSPTSPSSTRSGSKFSFANTPPSKHSKQSVTAALAIVRARKGSPSPKVSPRNENGMTKPANAFWSDRQSPRANRLPLTPKMQTSPKEQLSSTPVKLPASPPPSSPRSPMSSEHGSDNRSPHQKFFLDSFASRAHAPTFPALSIIAVGQENEGSDIGSPTSLKFSPRRSRRAALYRSRLNPRVPMSPRKTLDSSESSFLVPGSPSRNPHSVTGTSTVIEKANSEEEVDINDWHSAKEVGSVDSRSDAGGAASSEGRLDPAIQQSLNNFIDRLNDKEVEERPEYSAIIDILSSSDDAASVDPETLKEIASFIDLVSKKPGADDDDKDSDSSFDEEVPAETRAGINAFIESLEKKAQTPTNSGKEMEEKGEAFGDSSSDEEVRAARDIIRKARLRVSANDEIVLNRSDPFASPNPSNLAGEHLLQPASSKAEEDQGAGDSDQHTEINGETIEIAIASSNLTASLAKADEMREQESHYVRANFSEDETSYMRNAFLTGSDMDLSIDPILHDPSTMKSIDEDDNIERFLARTFTLPEGATKDDLILLNSYVRQAGNMMQNGSTQEERVNFIKYAIRDGVPKEVTQEIFMWLASAPEDDGVAQETKSSDEEESFDRFLRETLAGAAEEPCIEEEVGTDVLRINDSCIEICDTFERFNSESKTKEAKQSFEEEVGSDILTINEDCIEISHSFLGDLNSNEASDTARDVEASTLLNTFIVGSEVDVNVANRKKKNQNAKESMKRPRADKHPDIGIELSDSLLAASPSSALAPIEMENDDASYLFNAFIMGSDMDLSVDPIVPDPSTMKSIDEDDKIERFLARTFTLPEGATKKELVTLNLYIRQAGSMIQNGSTAEERVTLIKSAIRDGIPMDITEEIIGWFASSTEHCGATPAKLDDEKIANDSSENRGIVDQTLSEPSTSTSTTDFIMLARTTSDKEDTSTEDRKISLMNSFIDKLALREGASAEEIDHLNKFMKLAAPVLSGKILSDEEEVAIRRAAKSIGISVNVMDEVLSENGTLKLSPSGRTSASSADRDLSLLLAASSIKESQDQTVERSLDMGHSDLKNEVAADGGKEDGDGQVWSAEVTNGVNPIHRSVITEQQPSLSSRSTFSDPAGPFKSERPDENKQGMEDGQDLSVDDASEANPVHKGLVPEQLPTHSSHSTTDDHDGRFESLRPDENKQHIEDFKEEDEAQTFAEEEDEERQGRGFDYPVDMIVISEQQRTLHEINTDDHDGQLSPTIDKYDLPMTPVNCTKEETTASFMASFGINILETKAVMPQESEAPAANLRAPPPPFSSPAVSLSTRVPQENERHALPPTPVSQIEDKIGAPPPPPPLTPPPLSSKLEVVVPQQHERYALPPTPVSQIENKSVATYLLSPPPPPPLTPPPISSKRRVVVPQGSERSALPPSPASFIEVKAVAVNLPTLPFSSSPASLMTRGQKSERCALPPSPSSHVEENFTSDKLPMPHRSLSPFPDSPRIRGQESERYALPPTPTGQVQEKTVAISLTTSSPPSSPPPSTPKTKLVVPQSERYELPSTPASLMVENPVVTPIPLPPPQRRVAYAVHPEGQHVNQSSPRKSKEPPMLGNAAAAIAMWSSRTRKGRQHIPSTQQWKLSYKERTKNHLGYFNVDKHSLHDTSGVMTAPNDLDDVPWEDRDVKQRFLHEHSVSFSRNWFGNLSRRRGNDRHREPVCHPQSMKMPMSRLPERDWEKEWYLTWQSQKLSHLAKTFDSSSSHASSGYSSASSEDEDDRTARSIPSGSFISSVITRDTDTLDSLGNGEEESESEDGSWCDDEDAPECGYIVNVKQKIGERVSRIHPEYTSSLRKSRWRKKHFPRGTFPY